MRLHTTPITKYIISYTILNCAYIVLILVISGSISISYASESKQIFRTEAGCTETKIDTPSHCVPVGQKITAVNTYISSSAGNSSIKDVVVAGNNCVNYAVEARGQGEDCVGGGWGIPRICNCRGRGWLEFDSVLTYEAAN